ncbi:hypothetical protein PIB30_009633 [Stylosanthes scabra]|uniref:Uncharacterized protein n=1 Tax=Stylosanthes scabra TaxID=79078 RepID=A0ABU6S543_9FABA|nr:hypothetical protein [Stylosanthes scabra]
MTNTYSWCIGGWIPRKNNNGRVTINSDNKAYSATFYSTKLSLVNLFPLCACASNNGFQRRTLVRRTSGETKISEDAVNWGCHLRKYRIGTIRELKAVGIRVRTHSNINSFYPTFNHGILHLPQLTNDGSTAHMFLNLIAHEMCPDFHNYFEISSFLVFMSSLIDQPEDVTELRLAGIVTNELANDKQVADLFNKMDGFLVPETPLFAQVSKEIHLYFKSKRGKIKILSWIGEAYNTFLRLPWTIVALLAAALDLVLTFIRTWFVIIINIHEDMVYYMLSDF